MGSLFVKQVGALCWVKDKVVLVSSNDGKNWDIPVINLEDADEPLKKVEQAAWEEAGVLGHAESSRLGEYLHSSGGKMYKVAVYALSTQKLPDRWPKSGSHKRALFSLDEAIFKVDEFGLRDIFGKFKR